MVVPSERKAWLRWRTEVLHWREYIQRLCDTDFTQRAIQTRLCADDPGYFLVIFGALYEPRATVDIVLLDDDEEDAVDRPPGWYPWVPFAFQVDLIRWFEQVTSKTYDPLGRGDGIIEKSREMGASWLFCLLAAHGWLFLDNQTIMFMSSKAELVDNRGDPKSLFYKIRALVGIYDKVPREAFAPNTFWDGLRVRLPEWMTPHIVQREHDFLMKLVHPVKANTIVGETTTSTSGTSSRATWMVADEAAKNAKFKDSWGGLASVTFHRFALSSASLEFGPDFYELAISAKEANASGTPGPSYSRMDWWLHPLRSDEWLESERARSTDPNDFDREYGINYHAGYGDFYYPYAQQMIPGDVPYRQGIGQVSCSIDPGLGDPTAMEWFQVDAGADRHHLVESLMLEIDSAKFIVPILMGFPPDHEVCEIYHGHKDEEDIMEVMEITWSMRQRQEDILFYGDPFGNNAGGNDKTTFYDELRDESRRLSVTYPDLDPVVIRVQSRTKDGARGFYTRRLALSSLLQVLDVNNTPRCRQALKAWAEMRYGRLTVANERLRPDRGWGSHQTAAAEYYAVNRTMRNAFDKIMAKQNRTKKVA